MEFAKSIHVACAYMTGFGFLLRGILALVSNPVLQQRIYRVLPHLIDTCLLFSGIAMVIGWSLRPWDNPWLIAKITALALYILFGLLMLRWGSTRRRVSLGLLGGLAMYVYIVGAAHSKSLLSIISYLI